MADFDLTLLENIELVIFDSDGVLVEEGNPLPGASEIVSYLNGQGYYTIVLSNNSTRHPIDMMNNYKNQGIMVNKVINSGLLTANYLQKNNKSSAYIVGEKGLHQILREHSIKIISDQPDVVVVGMDRTLTYEKLAIATRAINNGADFIGTNPDKSFPTSRGLEPGAGSMIAALEASTGKKPKKIIGKPDPFGIEYILNETSINKNQAIMIGDRYETDIIAAIDAGIKGIVVNTGVASKRDQPARWNGYPEVPLLQNMNQLLNLFESIQ